MHLTWVSHSYKETDGYGRYNNRLMAALRRQGVTVEARDSDENLPLGADATVYCMPPFNLPESRPVAGPLWLLTMTEGSELPDGWADAIHAAGVDAVIVPCPHNADVFVSGGVRVPVHVAPGGTDPDEFPQIILPNLPAVRPYIFLTLGDRGSRKGWEEVWEAFFIAFGTPQDTPDVRLIVKNLVDGNHMTARIAQASNPDPRITFWAEDVRYAVDVYKRADCVALPSRSEGWGMPHREAAMLGLPVITTRYAGLDDGYTHKWSIPVETLHPRAIPKAHKTTKGIGMAADIDELAGLLRRCYDDPVWAAQRGQEAAAWLRANQTWDHAAAAFLSVVQPAELEVAAWH